jgi:hypothetical protein
MLSFVKYLISFCTIKRVATNNSRLSKEIFQEVPGELCGIYTLNNANKPAHKTQYFTPITYVKTFRSQHYFSD